MDISIEEYGLGFIWECLKRYQGTGFFLVVFLICLLALLKFGDHSIKKTYLPYLCVLGLSVYNIFLMQFIIRFLDLSAEYYRFIWLLPVSLVIAYVLTRIVQSQKTKTARGIAIAAGVLVIIVSGRSLFANNWAWVENVYKIPNEIIEISQMIHADTEEEQPKAAVEFDVATMLNQYDPSIRIAVPYGDVSTMQYYEDNGMEFDLPPYEQSRLHLYQVVTENIRLDNMEFAGSLKHSSVDYLVVARADNMEEYILTQSCELVGRTETYDVYRFIDYE